MTGKSRAAQELEDFDTVFKALAHASRRHILVVLQARGGHMTAGAIANRFACSWPTTSRHLRQLTDAGLVTVEKVGREKIVRLNQARLCRVTDDWLKWFR